MSSSRRTSDEDEGGAPAKPAKPPETKPAGKDPMGQPPDSPPNPNLPPEQPEHANK